MAGRARSGITLVGAALVVLAACDGELRFDGQTDASARTCAVDLDCHLSTLHCDTALGQCVECTADGQCPNDQPRCDVALHECVQCGLGGDCGQGQVCSARQCVYSCADGGACPSSDPTCNAVLGICTRCTTNDDCAGTPATPFCNSAGKCASCVRDDQCPSSAPYCDPDGDGCVQCVAPGRGCTFPQRCDPSTHVCHDEH